MLTDRAIKNIKAPVAGQMDLRDGADVKGLTLRVSQRSKVFYLSFRNPKDGKAAKIRIGEYPSIGLAEARHKGRVYRQLIERKLDPREYEKAEAERRTRDAESARTEAEQRANNTLARAIDDFVKVCERAGQRRWRERERQLRRYLPPEWSTRPLDCITRPDCKTLLDRLEGANGGVQANRVVQTLRTLYNWAIQEGRCERNPASKLRSIVREVSRDRVLSDTELVAVWQSSATLGEPYGPYVRFLILTGQRRGETAAMRWRDVDLEGAVWEIPAGVNKQARVHRVPLSAQAVALLRSLHRCKDDPGAFVFTTTMGRTAINGASKAKERIDRALTEAAGRGAGVSVTGWVFHDLRRTVASGMARLAIAPHVCEKVLGHESDSIRGVAAIYNRFDYADEKRRALEAWATHVSALTDTTRKVVSLVRRA